MAVGGNALGQNGKILDRRDRGVHSLKKRPMDTAIDQETPQTDSTSQDSLPTTGQATIDAPATNKAGTQLELEAKSVKSISHALNICKAVEQNNRQRAARTADIQNLHDGAPPHSAAGQLEKAKSWQSNASTNWLAGIVGRVSQRFVNAIVSQIYVSSSAVPDNLPDAKTKTDLMRLKFTQLVRSWDGYTGFINAECVETTLQGYCYGVFLDPYTWKPTFFKQDRAYVPEMSGQHARDLQFFVAKMDYRLDEFIALFRDEEAAKEVGYEITNCVYAANHATMADPREDATTTQFRKFVEMINEGSIGLSFTNTGARIVPCWLLFNREYDGRVSFWLIDRNSGKQLRFSFKLFPSMQDALAMFSFEPGNGCIHSSKGLGRKLANLAVMKELFRNSIIDNGRISGLTIIRADAADKSKFAPAIVAPFVIVDKSVEIPQQQFQANGEAYKVIDSMIDAWAEQAVGAYITQQIDDAGKTEKTATEATIDARRETEAADIQIRRQLDQFANMTQIQQRRAFSDDYIAEARSLFDAIVAGALDNAPAAYEGRQNLEPEVLRVLVEIMEAGVSDDEIRLWRESPCSPYAHVTDAAIQHGLTAVKQTFTGNPNVNQGELDYRVIEAMVGADLAKKLFIPQADQTVLAEGERQQTIESVTMASSGMPLPVSPRDNHIVHGETIQKLLTEIAAPQLAKPDANGDATAKVSELNLNHLGEHLAAAAQTDLAKTPQFKELQKFYEGFKAQLAEVVQIKEHAKVAAQAVTQQIQGEDAAAPVPLDAVAQGSAAPAALETGVAA